MIDEQQIDDTGEDIPEDESNESPGDAPERLTQAVRRERLAQLRTQIGEQAQLDGDVVVVEVGEPVVLHVELDRDGVYTLTWWATQLTENAHHRWRDAAATILREGEEIHTSALGGGYLIEFHRTVNSHDEALALAQDQSLAARARELVSAFPEAVAALPPEPVPDYLLPPEPELPPLGEAEVEANGDEDDDSLTGDETGLAGSS
jgi:hypothetical protein